MDAFQEQTEYEKLRAWWKDYGNAVIAGVVVGIALLFGNKYWSEHKERQRHEASELYEVLLVAAEKRDGNNVRASGAKLVEGYASTPYAGMAALVLAKQALDAGQRDEARKQLEWAMANGQHELTRHVARLRLARLLADGGDPAAALAMATVQDVGGFAVDYAELRGDLLSRQKRHEEARAAYRQALDAAREGAQQALLQLKLDSLGPVPASGEKR